MAQHVAHRGGRIGDVATADVVDVTLVLDTSIYASGDVLAIPQEVASVFSKTGQRKTLQSVVLLDGDDQAQPIDLVFFNATASLGTINAAVSISDADAAKIVGYVSLVTGDAKDLINSTVFVKSGIGQVMESAGTSLWVGAICRGGTPTYTASAMKVKLGFS